MHHRRTHYIWHSEQSLMILKIPAAHALCLEVYHIFDFVLMARLLVGVFTAKQNRSGLQQYIFMFLVPIPTGQLRFICAGLYSRLV